MDRGRESDREREGGRERDNNQHHCKTFSTPVSVVSSRQTNVGEMGPIFDGAKGLFHALLTVTRSASKKKIAL